MEYNTVLVVLNELLDGVVIEFTLAEVSLKFLLDIFSILIREEELYNLITCFTV